VEVRKENVKLSPILSMNSNVKLPMKTSAVQSLRKSVRLQLNNNAQQFKIRSAQQLLRSNVAMEVSANVALSQKL